MSKIFMEVVNSTTGLGNTEFSLCDGRGLLKFDKSAMDECCEMINNHDKLTQQVAELRDLLKEVSVIICEDAAVVDTLYYSDNYTLYEKIYCVINSDDKCDQKELPLEDGVA